MPSALGALTTQLLALGRPSAEPTSRHGNGSATKSFVHRNPVGHVTNRDRWRAELACTERMDSTPLPPSCGEHRPYPMLLGNESGALTLTFERLKRIGPKWQDAETRRRALEMQTACVFDFLRRARVRHGDMKCMHLIWGRAAGRPAYPPSPGARLSGGVELFIFDFDLCSLTDYDPSPCKLHQRCKSELKAGAPRATSLREGGLCVGTESSRHLACHISSQQRKRYKDRVTYRRNFLNLTSPTDGAGGFYSEGGRPWLNDNHTDYSADVLFRYTDYCEAHDAHLNEDYGR